MALLLLFYYLIIPPIHALSALSHILVHCPFCILVLLENKIGFSEIIIVILNPMP